MGKGRLEAFSDGVLAIIITIMVLELKVPHGDDLTALAPLLPSRRALTRPRLPAAERADRHGSAPFGSTRRTASGPASPNRTVMRTRRRATGRGGP